MKDTIKFEVRYYADVWTDEQAERRATYRTAPGEVVSLTALVEREAVDFLTYAVIYIGDVVIARYSRDIETRKWRES